MSPFDCSHSPLLFFRCAGSPDPVRASLPALDLCNMLTRCMPPLPDLGNCLVLYSESRGRSRVGPIGGSLGTRCQWMLVSNSLALCSKSKYYKVGGKGALLLNRVRCPRASPIYRAERGQRASKTECNNLNAIRLYLWNPTTWNASFLLPADFTNWLPMLS